jgi:hypothetical protein
MEREKLVVSVEGESIFVVANNGGGSPIVGIWLTIEEADAFFTHLGSAWYAAREARDKRLLREGADIAKFRPIEEGTL